LETLGKSPTAELLPEISGIVQKIGTNHLISRKTVSFSLSEDYDFIPSLLAFAKLANENSSPVEPNKTGGVLHGAHERT
jgi:hypothetical protein